MTLPPVVLRERPVKEQDYGATLIIKLARLEHEHVPMSVAERYYATRFVLDGRIASGVNIIPVKKEDIEDLLCYSQTLRVVSSRDVSLVAASGRYFICVSVTEQRRIEAMVGDMANQPDTL